MRLLLLQARNLGDPAAAHERDAFAREIGVDGRDITTWDLLGGAPSRSDLSSADCILVGGSGDFSLTDPDGHDWVNEFIDTMGELTTMDIPMFASCFGFQALIVACGGRIASDRSRAEFGTFEVTVSRAGKEDSLFREVAPHFDAQFGHADYADALPSGFINLGSTKLNEFQAARVAGKKIYLTQFHPELSMKANRERARMYLDSYLRDGIVDSTDGILDNFRESPLASGLLRKFIEDL